MRRIALGLVAVSFLVGCGPPGAGERGRLEFEVERGLVDLRHETVAMGTTVHVTVRATSEAQRPSEPVEARLVGPAGAVVLDEGRVDPTELRAREVARLVVSFAGSGDGFLEVVGARSGVLVDRLPVQVGMVESLEPELVGEHSGVTLALGSPGGSTTVGSGDVLTMCAGPVSLRYHFAGAGGQRLYGTPALRSAILGNDPSRALAVDGDQVTLSWTPTFGDRLGGVVSNAVTLGLANLQAAGELSVSDGANVGRLSLQLESSCSN